MINLNLANILSNIAEIKKSDKQNREKVLGIMEAARTLRDYPSIVKNIINGEDVEGEVRISDYISNMVREYLKTGIIDSGKDAEFTEELLKFIRVSGLGRKKLFEIYRNNNLKSLEELADLLDNGSSQIDEFDRQRLKASLNYLESIKGRVPVGSADFLIGIFLDSVRSIGEILKIEVSGSIRRKNTIIGDIDLLILPEFNSGPEYNFEKSRELLEKIQKLSFIKKFENSEEKNGDISGKFKTIYDIDIEIIVSSRNNWVYDLFYTTGNKKHVKEILKIAASRGLLKNGRFNFDSFPESEEDIYRNLNLQYIPPELREGRDEIELASRGKIPALICPEDLKGDLHIHSSYSDGLMSIEEIYKRALNLNYEYVGISDHSPNNYFGNGLDAERLREKINYLNNFKPASGNVRILKGAEVDIIETDKLDYPDYILEDLDIVIASLHSSFRKSKDENTAMSVSALENKKIDILAHPTGVVFGNRAPIFIDLDTVFEAALKNNKALEINSYYLRLDLDVERARKAAGMGIKLAINTDSHRPNNIEMIKYGIDIARKAGLSKEDVINTMSFKEMKEWQKNR